MITKHHNRDYTGGVPYAAGDRYYAQDIFRDAWYHDDRAGYILKDLVPVIPYIVSGGTVTKGAGDTLNITLGVGYAKYSVTVPNSFTPIPPSTQSQDIEAIRTAWDAQTNMAIPSAVLNGVAVNYVKVRYSESDGNSRQRAKKSGTYVFEKTPSFTIVVDTTPNTSYDILLNTFTGTAGGAFTFSGASSRYASRQLEVSNANYTILDNDGYDHIAFKSLSANRALYLPTLADNQGRTFYAVNLDGSYNVIVTPEGTELINDWNSTFEITEKYGLLKITALSDRWLVVPLNEACIYEVSTETADTGLTLDGTWDDVSGMTLLNGIYGYGFLDVFAVQYGRDTSYPTYLYLHFGIGNLSGNNAPNIKNNYVNGFGTQTEEVQRLYTGRQIHNYPYTSNGSVIYMKAKIECDELPIVGHAMYGTTGVPMYIKWRRIY